MPRAVCDIVKKPIKLKNLLIAAGIGGKEFQKQLNNDAGMYMSETSIRFMLNSGHLMKKKDFKDNVEMIVKLHYQPYLTRLKMQLKDIWEPILDSTLIDEEYYKKLKNYMEVTMLTQSTMKHFGLKQNPFGLDIRRESDIFMGSSHIFALEVMRETASTGGFAVITGEVGGGKSTVRRKFFEETKANKAYQIIYCETIDKTRLTSLDILHAIIYDLTEASPKGNKEALTRQVKKLLTDLSNNNEKVVLVIEEAHDLPISTLKFLKRIWELENGLQRLIGIILIGQNELENRLYGKNSTEIREVTARTSHARVDALGTEVTDYIKHRFNSVKADANKIITTQAIQAFIDRMQIVDRRGKVQSLAYPLMVNNAMVTLLNYAAEAGEEVITPDVVVASGV